MQCLLYGLRFYRAGDQDMIADHAEIQVTVTDNMVDGLFYSVFASRYFYDLFVVDDFTVVNEQVAGTFGNLSQ